MKKHTPAPWEYKNHGVVTQTPDKQVEYHDTPWVKAETLLQDYGGYLVCETVTEANGHLIAAAPELLSAIDALLSAIAHTAGVRENTALMEAVSDANTAKMKARGDLPQS